MSIEHLLLKDGDETSPPPDLTHCEFGDLNVRRVTFSVEQGRDGSKNLVLRQQALVSDLDPDEKDFPLVLAKNVKEFKTEFWDLRLHDWIDEWKQTNAIPVVVRVSLKLADRPYSSQIREYITRVVSIPSVTVQPLWQVPRTSGNRPGGPNPINPNMPGNPNLPPGVNPNYPAPNPNFPRGVQPR